MPQARGPQRDGIRQVARYFKQAVSANQFGRGGGGADQHYLVVFVPQFPGEFDSEGPVTGHDGML